MILVADSGSTKTNWIAINDEGETHFKIDTQGLNPAVFARELLQNPDQQQASQYMLLLRSAEAERVLSENNYARLLDVLVQNT